MPRQGLAVLASYLIFNVIQGTAINCTPSGISRIKLLGIDALPPSCLPRSNDFTGQAVFECLQSWKVHYGNCHVRLTPLLHNATSGLPCRFFTSTGNITGPHTARVQAAVDTPGLLAFLQLNPDIATRLSGNASPPASSQEVAENLALALKAFFTHHHAPHHSHSHSHRRHHKHLSTTKPPTRSSSASSSSSSAHQPSTSVHPHTVPLTKRLTPQLPPRRLLAATATLQQHTIRPAAASNPPPCRGTSCTAPTSGLPDLPGHDLADGDNPAEVTRVGSRLMFASDSCVYVYKLKRTSDFLNSPDPAPSAAGGWMVVVACLSGAAMMGLSIGCFLVAQLAAARQTRLAEALLLQQQEEQRRAVAERMASICNRPAPCSGSDADSTTTTSELAEAQAEQQALLLPAADGMDASAATAVAADTAAVAAASSSAAAGVQP